LKHGDAIINTVHGLSLLETIDRLSRFTKGLVTGDLGRGHLFSWTLSHERTDRRDHCVRFVFAEEVVRVGELDEMSAKTESFALLLRSPSCPR
jgi:hypothetical protein